MITLSHNGFARQSTVRNRWKDYAGKGCDECGAKAGGTLYEYGTQTDQLSGRINWHKGHFCSKPCHDASAVAKKDRVR